VVCAVLSLNAVSIPFPTVGSDLNWHMKKSFPLRCQAEFAGELGFWAMSISGLCVDLWVGGAS
jgi:hypothetical protein